MSLEENLERLSSLTDERPGVKGREGRREWEGEGIRAVATVSIQKYRGTEWNALCLSRV